MNEYKVVNWSDDTTLPAEKKTVLACFFDNGKKRYIVTSRVDFNFWVGVGRTPDNIAWMEIPEFNQDNNV